MSENFERDLYKHGKDAKRYALPEKARSAFLIYMPRVWREKDPNGVSLDNAFESLAKALSDNPIVPTDEDVDSVAKTVDTSKGSRNTTREFMVKWQSRMFIAPDPKDLTVTVPKAGTYHIDEDGKVTAYTQCEEDGAKVWRSPDNQVPEEAKDLLVGFQNPPFPEGRYRAINLDLVESRIIEAYRRGKKAGM